MKRFVWRIGLFLLLLFLADRLFILFRPNQTNLFNEIAREKMTRLSDIIYTKEDFPVWVMGSSHAQFGISPEFLSRALNVPAVNFAYGDGANMGAQYSLLQRLLKQDLPKPEVILLGIDVFALNAEPVYTDRFQSILFRDSSLCTRIRQSSYLHSYIHLYARNIPAYLQQLEKGNYTLPYFNKNHTADLSMFAHYEKYEISPKGWVMGFGRLNKAYIRYSQVRFNPSKKAIPDLKSFVQLCRKNQIHLVLIHLPEHLVCHEFSEKYQAFGDWMNKFARQQQIEFWDFNQGEKFPIQTDSLFFDSDHLNKTGAECFSDSLAKKLLKSALLK